MTVTILVLSVDEEARLIHCLPAALAQPGGRVVVIDNACTDRTAALCARLGVEVVALPERVSYARAINRGLAATEGDVLLLNADCVLDEGFLPVAVAALAAPGVGSVAPKLIRSVGMTGADRLDVLDTAGMFVDHRRKNGLVGHGEPAERYAQPGPCFGGDGACVLYRREVLDWCAIGEEVLDEDMALWATDVDLAWRAQLLGWSSVYEPRARAWHQRFYSPTTRKDLAPDHRRLQFRNRLLMIAKNETPTSLVGDLPRILFYELLALGFAVLRENHLLGGYAEAVRLLPHARRRARNLKSRRVRGRSLPFGLRPAP